ncbi:hypothetical protein AAFX91_38600 [Bradyrhizobium sp. 31Argb]|uniref:hypothetical protein n=1 Tax=Bradyrhizobium sp. 31Argb TaxID=3141247 RepID=UPI003749E2D1
MTELVFCCDQYAVKASVGGLPSMYSEYVHQAVLSEDLGIRSAEGTALFFAVGSSAANWPDLVVALRFSPGPESGFCPGILLVPDRHLVFVGAGTSLLAYKLSPVRRLWRDVADVGFWGWKRHGNIVLMSAELELAAWDVDGRKLWSTFVEPPWSYEVHGDRVELDVMGQKSNFPVATGPVRRAD